MRVSMRTFVGLATVGILMPGLVLLLWSSGKTQHDARKSVEKMEVSSKQEMERLQTNRDPESGDDFHADIFRAQPVVKQRIQQNPVKPWRPDPPRFLPQDSLKRFPGKPPRPYWQTPKPLYRENLKPLYRETPKPLYRESPKLLDREFPKRFVKGPPRPWVVEDPIPVPADASKSGISGNTQLKPEDRHQHEHAGENESHQKTWRDAAKSPQEQFRSRWWKQHMRKTCRDLDMLQTPQTLTPEMLQNVIVDDKNKLLFCQIPKVASTTWRRIFLQLTGKVDVSDFLSISADDIHHKYDNHFAYLSEFSEDQISQRLRDYFKFVFVREPFERLLSAYKNKFSTKTPSADYFKWKFGRKIIAQYRKSSPIPTNNTGDGVTFEEFVSYLIDEDKRIIMNEHWELFHKLCHPCLIEYDFVGHLERIDEDSQYILDSNNLSERIKVPNRKESKYGHRRTNSYIKEYYSKLDPLKISRLYQMYKADFFIFNYTIPADVSSLM
ncbi:carbohydrate sulfotransferase [Elysia marginata]|uniref:Carbohydrate sulfotransferase n=1 Tax=Elysia marginata TaxID=1093978 RepID=A0AAV4FEJ3_9GAST|nr:carbohydrate sulfotransferase [Elysia marginata]